MRRSGRRLPRRPGYGLATRAKAALRAARLPTSRELILQLGCAHIFPGQAAGAIVAEEPGASGWLRRQPIGDVSGHRDITIA